MSKKFPNNAASVLFFLFDSYSFVVTEQQYAKHRSIPKDFHFIGNDDEVKYYFCYPKKIVLAHYGQNEKSILCQVEYLDKDILLESLSNGLYLEYRNFEFPMLIKIINDLHQPLNSDQEKYQLRLLIKKIQHYM